MNRKLILFMSFLLIGVALHAQEKTVKPMFVSDNMARKIVLYIDNAWPRENGSNVMSLFMMANNITSAYECDKILEAIMFHKDKVENFIVFIINSYGKENSYNVFRNIGYSTFEYEMALNVYDNWLIEKNIQKKKEEERFHNSQRITEQKTIKKWNERGKDTIAAYKVKAPVFSVNVNGYDTGLLVCQDARLNKEKDMKQSALADKYDDRFAKENKMFTFLVDENGHIADLNLNDSLLRDIDSITVIKPGRMHFVEIDTTINIPTINYLDVEILRNIMDDFSTGSFYTYQYSHRYSGHKVVVNYNKKQNKWIIKDDKQLMGWYDRATHLIVKNTIGRADYSYSMLGVPDYNTFIELINTRINDKLKGSEGKRYEVSFYLKGGGWISYFINGKMITTEKLAFDMVFKSITRIK